MTILSAIIGAHPTKFGVGLFTVVDIHKFYNNIYSSHPDQALVITVGGCQATLPP